MPDEHSIPESGEFEDATQTRAVAERRAQDLEEEHRHLLSAQQDPAAFRWLYDRYYLRINLFLRGLVHDQTLAEDLTGQVFAQALATLPRYRWRGFSYGAYLHRIALNEVFGHWRHRPSLRQVAMDETRPLPDPGPDALSALVTAERERELRAAIAGLGRADRTVLAMHYWEELGVAEIAGLLGEPQGTIQARLQRAREKLRRHLRRQELKSAHGPDGESAPTRFRRVVWRHLRLDRDAE
ncbi:MAG: RNA polymerase sigma factor [Candidatus Krumholzibacteriia bacterium]